MRKNNMDALRLLFASFVVIGHSYAITKNPMLSFLNEPWFDGAWAVRGFFILSGFLIFQSYETSSSPKRYFIKRFRRIYPAYAAVVVLTAIIGSCVSMLSLHDYMQNGAIGYAINNLAFLNWRHPTLPGVFSDNPIEAVNGALWTIKIEVAFYVSVPIICALCRRIPRTAVFASIYIASIIWLSYFTFLGQHSGNEKYLLIAKQIPGQMCYFISGASIYYFTKSGRMIPNAAKLMAALSFVVACMVPYLAILLPASMAILVMSVAFGPYLGNAGRYGDFSYGIYIWHFPILQMMVPIIHYSVSIGLLESAILIAVASCLSWHLIERPWLRADSHYRRAEIVTVRYS